MILNFVGDICGLEKGIEIFSKELNFNTEPRGLTIKVEKREAGKLEIVKNPQTAYIKFSKKIHFFRALGLFIESLIEQDEFEIYEEPQFTMNGTMFDVSQGNAVINVENVQRLLRKMAIMGLNMMMIYVEDSYEIKDEPYFGYMRGKYTYDELKECDAYADIFGIEMIPCMQTLAHLVDTLRWDCYDDLKDDADTLMVGYNKSYAFIEKMIVAASAPFSTKRIHIGMDEAWNLGQGRYLHKNGYKSKFEIMKEHLGKVMEIVKKHDLQPMMWSDMYFRSTSKSGDNYYDVECDIPDDVINANPKEMQLVYWDYFHEDPEFCVEWIDRHKKFGSLPIFAGGIWNYNGFGVNYEKTFNTTNAALEACKRSGVEEIYVTIWGDSSTECNIYEVLLGMQLYAEHGYSRILDETKLKKRFKFCTGANYDDYRDIGAMDEIPGFVMKSIFNCVNPCQYAFYQDILLGLFDENIRPYNLAKHYALLRNKMAEHSRNNGEFNFVFEYLEKACAVLEIKADMGIRLTEVYRNQKKEDLKFFIENELPELSRRIIILRKYHKELWFKTNKPFGWEVHDVRYGSLLMRIETVIDRLSDYLEGRINKIEELEQQRLSYSKNTGLVFCNKFTRMVSASRLSI